MGTGALVLSGCGDQTDGAGGSGGKDKAADVCKTTEGGSDKSKQPSGGPTADPDAALPAKLKDRGVLKVGTDAAYKPMEYKDGGKIVGLDVDIAKAIGKKLGVRFEFTNGTFDGLITALQTGRFDMVMSSMTDTKDRQEGLDEKGKKVGKGVDFVDYLTAGSSILVQKGNEKGIECLAQLCGEKVATQRGTTSHELLKNQTEKCEKDGKQPIAVEPFATDDEARVRLKSGGVVADVADFPVAAHAAANGDDFELTGEQMESAPYGMAVSKDETELRDALHGAMRAIIEDGSYEKALKKWGVEDGAVSKSTINAGV
ncbi:ABC transporter substrate-binding protein [Streptomyces sp. AJS327]|nr:ABC transporter substrate-binding protein [Streptomyces sp. AJS327]